MYRLRLFWWVLLTAGLMVVVLRQDMAASNETAVYSGVAQISGPLQLDLSITPPIVSPGTNLTLTVRLLNHTQVTYTPQISLQLPTNIQPEMALLPAGATINLQTNSLNWLPIVLANGGEQVLSLPLRVETADLTQPEQMITAVLSYDEQSFTTNTTIWVGIPPQITTILSPPQAAVGLPIQLQAAVAGSGPTTQSWQLGDGRQVHVTDPIIVYPSAGMYEITLEASNPLATASRTQLIHIVPHPAAQFLPDDDTPGVGQAVNFLNQSGGQPPISYLWDFGDGTTADSIAPSHTYMAPGIYQVRLTIQNSFGQSEAFWTILVNSAPLAEMVLPESGQVGQPVIGQAYGDESVQVFHWDMGDGHSYNSSQVQHIYTQTGDYYVTLMAYNDFGGTPIGRWIHINPGFLNIFLPVVFKTAEENTPVDPYGLDLEPVELAAPFVLTPIPMPENSTIAEQLFIYINEARRHFSLQPLNYQYNLSTAAQQHTDDMAAFGYTAHNGSDGSFPAERLLWMGYNAGYAGEATAWGFEHPYQAVEFWVNSPAHRKIILNQYATEVGVGFTVDYAAPNVWYWTAEFGNAYAPVTQPLLRVGEPLAGLETMITTPLTFSWNWPIPLQAGQQFTVYLLANGRAVPLGSVAQPFWGTRYELETAAYGKVTLPGAYEWQVKLETNNQPVVVGESRSVTLLEDPNLPTPTPVITPSPTPTQTATPTVTPTPTIPWPTDTPPPPPPTPVILVTATPQP